VTLSLLLFIIIIYILLLLLTNVICVTYSLNKNFKITSQNTLWCLSCSIMNNSVFRNAYTLTIVHTHASKIHMDVLWRACQINAVIHPKNYTLTHQKHTHTCQQKYRYKIYTRKKCKIHTDTHTYKHTRTQARTNAHTHTQTNTYPQKDTPSSLHQHFRQHYIIKYPTKLWSPFA